MARYPGAIWRGPVPGGNYAAGPTPKIGMVVHVIVGSADSAIGEFMTPGLFLSAHFVVSGPGDPYADGTCFQLLDTDDCCYAQAAGNFAPTAYVAVEFSGHPDTPMSAGQVLTGQALARWLSTTHHFPLTGPVAHGTPGVTAHSNPDGSADPAWGNHACPGPLRLPQIAQMVRPPAPAPKPPPPLPPPEDQMHAVVTQNGDVKVYAAGAGDRAGHLLEFTRHQADQSNSVIDITAQIGGGDPYTVQP